MDIVLSQWIALILILVRIVISISNHRHVMIPATVKYKLYGYMAFLPLAKTHLLCFWQFGFITDYDRVVDDILQVENKILPIVQKLTKTHPQRLYFC